MFLFVALDCFLSSRFCDFDGVAKLGVFLCAALTTRATGCFSLRLSIFMTCALSESLALSFCSSPFRLFCFSFAVSVQVIGPWLDVDVYVQIDLEGIWFH